MSGLSVGWADVWHIPRDDGKKTLCGLVVPDEKDQAPRSNCQRCLYVQEWRDAK